jgi:hypothetical protein
MRRVASKRSLGERTIAVIGLGGNMSDNIPQRYRRGVFR